MNSELDFEFLRMKPEGLEKRFRVIGFHESSEEAESGGRRALEGVLLLSMKSIHQSWREKNKRKNLIIPLKIQWTFSSLQQASGTILSTNNISNRLISRALVNHQNPVVEIMENTYLDVVENKLYQRNFDAELERLWKDLGSLSEESVVDVLIRLTSLGYECLDVIEELNVKEILEDLWKEGWKEGINYYKLKFDRY